MFSIILNMAAKVNPALITEYVVPSCMSFETAKKLIMDIKDRSTTIVHAYTTRIKRVLMHVFMCQRQEILLTTSGMEVATFHSSNDKIHFGDIDIDIKYVDSILCKPEHVLLVKDALKHDIHRRALPIVFVE